MSTTNMVMLLGNVGKDPEVRYTKSGIPVANFSLATNESWTSKTGEKKTAVEWHRIVVWGKQAEACGQYLQKGRQVAITGRIQTRKWNDKNNEARYTTEIHANQITFLGSKSDNTKDESVELIEPQLTEEAMLLFKNSTNQPVVSEDISF